MTYSIAINAGGQSSRMGTNKAFVVIDGRPMIERIIERVTGLNQAETFLVTNTPEDYAYLGLRMVADVLLDSGSLGGIYTALHHSPTPYTLVLACDMPFINPAILQKMLDLADGKNEVIVPRVDGYPQGLHAIYQQNCQPHIQAKLEAQRLKVIGFYNEVQVCYLDEDAYQPLDPHGVAFMNINTPEELAEANRLAQDLNI